MKIQIPEALKQDVPQTVWGRILTATPIIMTVVATALAGLASSEMTRAQYSRSLGAQQQAKAGDQWGFFQAKRLRAAMQRTTFDLIQATAGVHALAAEVTAKLDAATVAALQQGELPALPPAVEMEAAVKAALGMLEAGRPDEEISEALAGVPAPALTATLLAMQQRVAAFDAATTGTNRAIDALEKSLAGGAQETVRDFTAARARYSAARYDAEARLNQAVAQTIELQVRKSNLIAERLHRRSQRFFFGMLAAQAAVIVSTFSLAAQKRSMLWTVAAGAGVAAIAFAIYVYFYV
jgi:hypothetical protein